MAMTTQAEGNFGEHSNWGHHPDPSSRTVEVLGQAVEENRRDMAIHEEIRRREHAKLKELLETKLADMGEVSQERVASIRREMDLHEAHRIELKADAETHRLELKGDGEKTLATATIAAEKAVQAALAAAEKARDQQTIASQLATTKAEESSKEQMKQQGETSAAAINALNAGLNDVKSLVGELRAERRGSQEQVSERRAGNAQIIATAALGAAVFGGVLTALLVRAFGG